MWYSLTGKILICEISDIGSNPITALFNIICKSIKICIYYVFVIYFKFYLFFRLEILFFFILLYYFGVIINYLKYLKMNQYKFFKNCGSEMIFHNKSKSYNNNLFFTKFCSYFINIYMLYIKHKYFKYIKVRLCTVFI